ncbi:MAG: helix-turn-helix domain-containing protein [Acidobacteriota bacterium]
MEPEALSEAKRRVIDQLKRSGPVAAGAVAKALGLTVVAVRQHLQALEAQGLVEPRPQAPSGRGRPSIHWALLPAADTLFPDRHADLTVGLIEAAREAFGQAGLDRLIEVRARDQTKEYQRLLPRRLPLAKRVQRLADQRTAEGYMAEVAADDSGDLLLIEHHCPICEAARRCVGLCAAELEVFQKSLGDDVEVERARHLLSDGDRCVYRIRRRREAE